MDKIIVTYKHIIFKSVSTHIHIWEWGNCYWYIISANGTHMECFSHYSKITLLTKMSIFTDLYNWMCFCYTPRDKKIKTTKIYKCITKLYSCCTYEEWKKIKNKENIVSLYTFIFVVFYFFSPPCICNENIILLYIVE